MSAVQSHDLKLTELKLSGMKVYPYGDAAVVTGAGHQVGTYKGQNITGDVVFTDTFVMRNGTWQVVASQRAPMAK